jgi:CRISPR/Cas system CSM-associated protein Csm3 (group 7 of RAMP superfamily)
MSDKENLVNIDDVIIFKYYVKGKLKFKSPLVLGCGEESNSDKDLIRNWHEKVFIPGFGIAGPSRHFLDSILEDDGKEEHQLIRQVFGEREKDSRQSLITFYDGDQMENVTIKIRDGVALDYLTKTAKDKAKYNYEIMESGAHCRFRIELTIRGKQKKDEVSKIENILFLILNGFSKGDIRLGAKNARGFGEVELCDIKILKLDISNEKHRDKWIGFDWDDFNEGNIQMGELPQSLKTIQNRDEIKVEFKIPYSMLIRAPNPDPEEEVDVVHLSSNGKSIITGPTWAGVLRNSIFQISREIDEQKGIEEIVEKLFGFAKTREKVPKYEDRAQKSRIFIKESIIEKNMLSNHTRNKIDRFSGGTVDTALFTEKPSFGGEVVLDIGINNAKEYEKGLVLLGIKEMWHGLQPIGGGSNIGRGILEGCKITINASEEYNIKDISVDFNDKLKKYLTPLVDELRQ